MNSVQHVSGAINPGDCISNAWGLVTRNFGLYLGVGIVTILLISCVPFISILLYGPVMAGYYYIVLRDSRDEPVEFGMMFKGFEKFLPLMLVGLIQMIPSLIATALQWTVDIARLVGSRGGRGGPDFYQSGSDTLFAGISIGLAVIVIILAFAGVIWSVALSFAVPLVLEHDLSISDALMTSVKAAFSNIGGLIVLIILEALVALLGFIAICLGLLVAIPVIYAANALAYRQVFPYFEKGGLNMTPPPPTEYGGTYGSNY